MPSAANTIPNPVKALTRHTLGLNLETVKKTILMVNNYQNVHETLRKALEAKGHRVELAETGQEGVRRFLAERFDLLLLDVNLPDTSGWNIFRTLTAINPFLPIIITGKNDQHELAVFEGDALLARWLDVPKILQTITGDARRFARDPSPMKTTTAG